MLQIFLSDVAILQLISKAHTRWRLAQKLKEPLT
jgi:hypothetical protein